MHLMHLKVLCKVPIFVIIFAHHENQEICTNICGDATRLPQPLPHA